MKKLQKVAKFLKNLKEGIGIKSQKNYVNKLKIKNNGNKLKMESVVAAEHTLVLKHLLSLF